MDTSGGSITTFIYSEDIIEEGEDQFAQFAGVNDNFCALPSNSLVTSADADGVSGLLTVDLSAGNITHIADADDIVKTLTY